MQAGQWVEAIEWSIDDRYEVSVVLDQPYQKPFGLLLRGESMNREYPDGTLLICVNVYDLEGGVLDRDHVIVQRTTREGLIEATCKEVVVDPDKKRAWLWPRSDDPEHQQPIPVPWPPDTVDRETETIAITSVVVGSIKPRPRHRTR